MNKGQFLAKFRAERATLDDRLALLSDAQLTMPPAPGEWSVKEALAHVTFWEQSMLARVRRAVSTGETMPWVDNEEETRLNAQILEDSQRRSLIDVLGENRRSFQQVIALVESLPESDLIDSQRFDWLEGKPLWEYLADEAYGEHYEEHLKF